MPPSISLIGRRGNRQTGIQFHNGGEGGSGRLIILVVVHRIGIRIRIDIRMGSIRISIASSVVIRIGECDDRPWRGCRRSGCLCPSLRSRLRLVLFVLGRVLWRHSR